MNRLTPVSETGRPCYPWATYSLAYVHEVADVEVTLAATRRESQRRGLELEYFTIGRDALEAAVGAHFRGARGFRSPVAFALDSVIEASSGGILLSVLLFGQVANALFGRGWADPIAGLGIALFAAKEGRELWTTKDLCCR
jgi:hypothetical protein